MGEKEKKREKGTEKERKEEMGGGGKGCLFRRRTYRERKRKKGGLRSACLGGKGGGEFWGVGVACLLEGQSTIGQYWHMPLNPAEAGRSL